jgi:hypothetical protein
MHSIKLSNDNFREIHIHQKMAYIYIAQASSKHY